MSEVQTRPACFEDCEVLARIIIDATHDAFHGRVPDGCLEWITLEESITNWAKNFVPGGYLERGGLLYVAESRDVGVIGLAMAGKTTTDHTNNSLLLEQYPCDLHSLQVDPSWQNKGVGRLLLSEVASAVLAADTNSLLVRVLRESPNIGFYERMGAIFLGSQPFRWEGFVTEELLFGWDNLEALRA